MFAHDYRMAGRTALRGHWGLSVVVTLVAGLLGASVTGASGLMTSAGSAAGRHAGNTFWPGGLWNNAGPAHADGWGVWLAPLWGVLAAIGTFMAIYGLVVFLFGGAVDLGLKRYNTLLVQGTPQPTFGTLFSRFSIFGRALLLQLATALFVLLWSILFIVPGIIAGYRYAMAPYIMANNPSVGVLEALNRSKQLMAGHKGRLFCLDLSFIGWYILGALTLGIGLLWIAPYVGASRAAFYQARVDGRT